MQDGDDPSIEAHRHAVRALTEELGPEHPETIKKRFILGFSLHRSGRLEEAEREYRIVLQRRISTLGHDHSDTMLAHRLLVDVLVNSGRLEEAEREHRIVLQRRISTLGDDHPDTLAGRVNHGLMLDRLGRLEEAEQEQLAVLETAERLSAPDERHLLFRVSRSNLEATQRKLQA